MCCALLGLPAEPAAAATSKIRPGARHANASAEIADASRPALRASAHVRFQEGASDGRDRFDGYELSPIAATSRGLFTSRLSDGLPLDIQALAPTSGSVEIPVGVTGMTDGAASEADLVLMWPRLDGYSGPAFLVVGVTREVVDLRLAQSYAFRVEASETRARPASPDAGAPSRPVGQSAWFTLVLGQRPVADVYVVRMSAPGGASRVADGA